MSVKGCDTAPLTGSSAFQSDKDHGGIFCINIQKRLVYSHAFFFFLEHLLSESVKHDGAE